jgi:glucose-6-phosphate isomerase/transaldolase/glucose-6-phosphate isomerase
VNGVRIDYSLGEYQSAINSALEKLRRDKIVERITAKDYTVWKPAPDEIVNRLGWLDVPAQSLEKVNFILAIFEPLKSKNFNNIVLLGMGGSSLAPEVFSRIIGSKPGYPKLHILDTTDPVSISTLVQNINLGNTLFLVSSKSGTTLEINSLLKYFYNLCFKNSGKSAGSHFIFITDEGSPLVKTAENLSAHYTFFSKTDIGGRYSGLSVTGIVPAAFTGIDVRLLLERTCSHKDALITTGASLGTALGILAGAGREKLTFILPPHWKVFGDWLEQLIAESTGKEGKGILPVLDEPFTENTAYGKDRVFVIFKNKEDQIISQVEFLKKAGHPVITVEINDDFDLGIQMFIWEMATAVSAHFLGVNPFDQPDVEATKKHTRAMITNYNKNSSKDEKPALKFEQGEIFGNVSGETPAEVSANFLKQGKSGDYICLQIYLSPSPEIDEAISVLRKTISQKYMLPVTCGYGPRYLHSTGQLHKGDSGNGLFIQLTQDYSSDIGIPDNPGEDKSSLSFGTLKAFQAQGDWQALTDAGRRIIRFHFRSNSAASLKNLAEMIL